MFENAINSKKQGDIGMCYAIAFYSKKGWTVSIPVTDSQDYDLVVDDGDKLLKVQVKTTRSRDAKKKSSPYIVYLRTTGGNKSGQTAKKFTNNKSDIVFILTDSGELYSIPRVNITSKSFISLGKDKDIYKVSL